MGLTCLLPLRTSFTAVNAAVSLLDGTSPSSVIAYTLVSRCPGVRPHRSAQESARSDLTSMHLTRLLLPCTHTSSPVLRAHSHQGAGVCSHQPCSCGALAGCNNAGDPPRRAHSHRSFQDHSPRDLASRDALAGCHRTGYTLWVTHVHRSSRIIPARTSCPGMHSLAAAAPTTPHGEPTPIDPSRSTPRASYLRVSLARGKCPGSLATAPPHQGTGFPGMALVGRTSSTEHSPLCSPGRAFLLS
jgi:hypothetical protein